MMTQVNRHVRAGLLSAFVLAKDVTVLTYVRRKRRTRLEISILLMWQRYTVTPSDAVARGTQCDPDAER